MRGAFVLRPSGHSDEIGSTWKRRGVEHYLVAPRVEDAIGETSYFASKHIEHRNPNICWAVQQEHESS